MRGARSESSRYERYNLRVEPTAYGGGSRANPLGCFLNMTHERLDFLEESKSSHYKITEKILGSCHSQPLQLFAFVRS